jgi:hypothetical protein
MKEQQFKVPGFEFQEINTGTPLSDGAELDFHKANPALKTYTEIAMNAALNTMPEIKPVPLFERQPVTPLEQINVYGERAETMRRAEAQGIEIDTLAVDAMQGMVRGKLDLAA